MLSQEEGSKYSMWEFKNAAGFSSQPYRGGGSLGYKYVKWQREESTHRKRLSAGSKEGSQGFNPPLTPRMPYPAFFSRNRVPIMVQLPREKIHHVGNPSWQSPSTLLENKLSPRL